jgi:hypothetical protein
VKIHEAKYMGRVAELGCILCDQLGRPNMPAQVHHVREGQGMAQRANSYLTVPLCPQCHTGTHGIHGDRQLLKQAKLDEMDLLALTIERLTNG